MSKYQFYILIDDPSAQNTAAYKAINDTVEMLSAQGYQNLNIRYPAYRNKLFAYSLLMLRLTRFLLQVPSGSLVAVQYPLLSTNSVFKNLIQIARLRKIRFFCLIHDLDSIRYQEDAARVVNDVDNLNHYDAVIVHNPKMLEWLKAMGVRRKMISLGVFDYLTRGAPAARVQFEGSRRHVVFAGNLIKSRFIYSLGELKPWDFTVYGPNFDKERARGVGNLRWGGEYSPEAIVSELRGDFGLIWDGERVDEFDTIFGNYLKYNNPHKFSLYLAAGLPVIAPRDSAIGELIEKHCLGLLIENLHDLQLLQVTADDYSRMKENVMRMRKKVTSGFYLSEAVREIEEFFGGKPAGL